MNYQETLDYLYMQLPMFQRVGAPAMKKGLNNILALCEALGNPHKKYPCLHIAGTNGKGSSAHMLSAIFQAHGYKTALYTSPHYRDFRERIKVDGQLIPEQGVIDFVSKNDAAIKEIRPSFFEITVAMAFDYFANQNVDFAIIETGLGGRLDSTNIVTPLLSLITNISLDHQRVLGDTLPLIAGEKAGIIKQKTPVVISESHEETAAVFKKKAKEMQADIYFADQELRLDLRFSDNRRSKFDVFKNDGLIYPYLELGLAGNYQAKNLCGVLQTLEVLKEKNYSFDQNKIRYALRNVKKLVYFIGRCQWLSHNPRILADSGHNQAGLTQFMAQVSKMEYEQLHFVFGTVKDKDPSYLLQILPKKARYYIAKANIPRGMNTADLLPFMHAAGLEVLSYPSVNAALEAAKSAYQEGDLILVGGSTFVVAEVV